MKKFMKKISEKIMKKFPKKISKNKFSEISEKMIMINFMNKLLKNL